MEEALVTWLPVALDGATATIRGERHTLRLTIERPAGARFTLGALARESAANGAAGVLQRLAFALPAGATSEARVRLEVFPQR